MPPCGNGAGPTFVLPVIVVVFALIGGLFGEMLESYRPPPDTPYAPNVLFSAS